MDDYGRFRSELSFEEKVFIHAELTPMAKPKKPSVSTTKVGLVKAQIETAVDSHTGKTCTRYRTYCTKAIVPKDQQRREWPSMDDAHVFATKLNAAIQAGEIEEIYAESILVLKRITTSPEAFSSHLTTETVSPSTLYVKGSLLASLTPPNSNITAAEKVKIIRFFN